MYFLFIEITLGKLVKVFGKKNQNKIRACFAKRTIDCLNLCYFRGITKLKGRWIFITFFSICKLSILLLDIISLVFPLFVMQRVVYFCNLPPVPVLRSQGQLHPSPHQAGLQSLHFALSCPLHLVRNVWAGRDTSLIEPPTSHPFSNRGSAVQFQFRFASREKARVKNFHPRFSSAAAANSHKESLVTFETETTAPKVVETNFKTIKWRTGTSVPKSSKDLC